MGGRGVCGCIMPDPCPIMPPALFPTQIVNLLGEPEIVDVLEEMGNYIPILNSSDKEVSRL